MNRNELASHIDLTMVQNDHSVEDIQTLIDAAVKYQVASVFVMPCYLEMIAAQLKETKVCAGGIVGFPGGGDTTAIKLAQARESVALGADEVDMVINVGWLKSGFEEKVKDEIRAVKDTIGNLPLKCIIEVNSLTEDEIRTASELVIAGGGDYVKTGTGWKGGTQLHHVVTIKETVGERALVKAAGGIRTKETALSFIEAGAERLGISASSAIKILEECEA